MTNNVLAKMKLPTDTELELLNILWQLGPATVRQVHENLSAYHPMGYTSVLKLLQIMHTKGLVLRDEDNRAHVYMTVASRAQIQAQVIADVTSKAFAGCHKQLILQTLSQIDCEQSKADIVDILRQQLTEPA
ncbi:BlaI/MecI/CopY family transcriptional regulator [Thalassotalea sp. Y01]|uniref:BlaI/MecI/CopY family transcriptional regulator n=1 Tax=Thalassotalea sp. Y01 TaxID=2729613 RepID=UPI001B7D58EF|nr:BlaI/MecI/CopY family transcriptional regulator [Thalassotalea sp. Y01]